MTSPEDLRSKNMGMWFRDGSENTLRTKYLLDENSVVFDLGGYKGEWAQRIYDKYHCFIYVFEPVSEFAANIKSRFGDNEKIKVFDFGLAPQTSHEKLGISGDSSSVYLVNDNMIDIDLMSIGDFLEIQGIRRIDLMKLNIEGSEYDLLEYILSTDLINIITDVQVQFHCIPNAGPRREEIRRQLANTHTQTYNYDFVHENWHLVQKEDNL